MPSSRRRHAGGRLDDQAGEAVGHLLMLQTAGLWTKDNFPPYTDRKQDPDPTVGRVV